MHGWTNGRTNEQKIFLNPPLCFATWDKNDHMYSQSCNKSYFLQYNKCCFGSFAENNFITTLKQISHWITMDPRWIIRRLLDVPNQKAFIVEVWTDGQVFIFRMEQQKQSDSLISLMQIKTTFCHLRQQQLLSLHLVLSQQRGGSKRGTGLKGCHFCQKPYCG